MFNVRKLLISSAVLVLVLSFCTSLAFADSKGIISGNRVNIREKTSTASKVLKTLDKGTSVVVVSSSGNWTKIRYGNVTGWVYSDFLSVTAVKSKTVSTTGTVTAQTLNVRSKADLSSSVVAKLKEGESVTILAQTGDWYKIKVSGGKTGWVYSEYISTKKSTVSRGSKTSRGGEVARNSTSAQSTTTGGKIVEYSKNFLGIKYVYGGNSPKEGFDCSGFTKYVYAQFGVSLERTAAEQASQGKKVDRDNLGIGDLVFFDTDGGHNHINHVGIYIGSGKFIHASSPRYDVTITNLSDDYYARSYMTARRIIN